MKEILNLFFRPNLHCLTLLWDQPHSYTLSCLIYGYSIALEVCSNLPLKSCWSVFFYILKSFNQPPVRFEIQECLVTLATTNCACGFVVKSSFYSHRGCLCCVREFFLNASPAAQFHSPIILRNVQNTTKIMIRIDIELVGMCRL